MVKRIECVTKDEKEVTGIIDFKYDKCNKLCGLVIKEKYIGSTVFNKNGNTMTRVDYNTKRIVKPIKFVKCNPNFFSIIPLKNEDKV